MFMSKGYLAAAPRKRLVGNVGAGDSRAVHHNVPLWYDAIHFQDVWEGDNILIHPTEVKADIQAIHKTENRITGKAAGGLTFFGNQFPALRKILYKIGYVAETMCPALFRISW